MNEERSQGVEQVAGWVGLGAAASQLDGPAEVPPICISVGVLVLCCRTECWLSWEMRLILLRWWLTAISPSHHTPKLKPWSWNPLSKWQPKLLLLGEDMNIYRLLLYHYVYRLNHSVHTWNKKTELMTRSFSSLDSTYGEFPAGPF